MKKFVIFLFSIAYVLTIPNTTFAADFTSLQINSTVTVNEDNTQLVEHTLSASSQGEGAVTLPLIAQDAQNVEVELNGSSVQYDLGSSEFSKGPFLVSVANVDFIPPQGDWEATVSYTTSGLMGDGAIKTLAIPSLDFGVDQVEENISVLMPLELGIPAAIGYQANDSSVGGGQQQYDFNFESTRDKSVILHFATNQSYELTWDEELRNTGFWWQTKEIVLAPDTNQQIVRISDINPKPSTIRLDQDGNIIASYTLGPKRSVKVEATALVSVRSVRYSIDETRAVSEVPSTLSSYTQQQGLWTSGTSITAETSKELLETIYAGATEKAKETSKENYLDFINKLIADIRASGLPARLISGIITHNGAQVLGDAQKHYWVEVYLPGTGWMTVDPGMNVMYKQFGIVDAFHIAEFIRGVDSEKPKSNPNSVNFQALTEPADISDEFEPEISQTKFMLVPGLSFVKTTVAMPAGGVVDGLGYLDQSLAYKLGSLAPLQEVSRWSFKLGSNSWGPSEVGVGYLNGDSVDVVATADSKLSYLPVVLLVVVFAAAVVAFRKFRKKKNRPVKVSEADEDILVEAEDLLKKPRRLEDDNNS